MMPWITPALRRVGAAAARRRPLAATQGQRPPPHRLASSSSTHASGASHPLPQALLLTAAAASTTAVAVALCSASLEEEGSAQAAAGPGPHYDRVDTKLGRAYPEFLKFHLIHETLRGKEKIEAYEVYKDKRDDSVVAFARLGKLLSGHPDIIHGGSIAALLDNTMGVAFFAAKRGNGFTANLTINYKRPILCGTVVKLLARVEKVEGRKVFLKAEIRDAKEESILYTEATSLFITSQSPLLTGPKKVDLG